MKFKGWGLIDGEYQRIYEYTKEEEKEIKKDQGKYTTAFNNFIERTTKSWVNLMNEKDEKE